MNCACGGTTELRKAVKSDYELRFEFCVGCGRCGGWLLSRNNDVVKIGQEAQKQFLSVNPKRKRSSHQNKWRLVEDEVPEDGALCMVTGGHEDVFVARWSEQEDRWRVSPPKGMRDKHLARYGWGIPKEWVYAWQRVDHDIPTKRPVDIMQFGKYKGYPFNEIPDAYLEWASENIKGADVRFAASKELEDRCVNGVSIPDEAYENRKPDIFQVLE